MASISSRNLVDAVLRVEQMGFQERERLANEIHARQPNLFFSVLVLQRYGATLEQLDVVLNLLFVFFEAMRSSGSHWPVISEEVQERCLARISGRVRFIEGLTPQLQAQATADAVGDHAEQAAVARLRLRQVQGKRLTGRQDRSRKDADVGSAEPGRVHR